MKGEIKAGRNLLSIPPHCDFRTTPKEFRSLQDDALARGNLQINIGPCADSSIPEIQARAVLWEAAMTNCGSR